MLYNPKTFFTHAALLDQGFPHCPIFPTAASRRSLGRVSVPVWLIILSDQLSIIALVGLYPTNKLIERRLLHRRLAPLTLRCHAVLASVSQSYPPPMDRYLRVTHPSATNPERFVRLACVKHAASVRSEPGSNSQVHHISTLKHQYNKQSQIQLISLIDRNMYSSKHLYKTRLSKDTLNKRPISKT